MPTQLLFETVDVVLLEARQWGSHLRDVTWDGLVRLRCSISLPGEEGQAGRKVVRQKGWTAAHRCGYSVATTSSTLVFLYQPKGHTAHATCGWISPLLHNHCYYTQTNKQTIKNCSKLLKGHYWNAKTASWTFFQRAFQQYCYVAPISFLSLDLRCYFRSSCLAKQLLVTPGKWLYRYFTVSIALSLHFRAKSLWHGGISAALAAGANTLGRTNSGK